MSTFKGRPFYPVNSTEPGFNSTNGSTSQWYALASTATNRFWRQPSNRAIRTAIKTADDVYMVFGTTTAVATSSGGMLLLGGTAETHYVPPHATHVAFASSTDVIVNVTLGVGA